jgi:L-aspartate semialdehyde sulfurtransferase ferredoxin
MIAQRGNEPQSNPTSEDNRVTTTQITIRVPRNHHQEPIICNLVADHGLVVNIKAAILGEDSQADGWFTLELKGTNHQIQSAIVYLEELDLEFWEKTDTEEENW